MSKMIMVDGSPMKFQVREFPAHLHKHVFRSVIGRAALQGCDVDRSVRLADFD